MSQAGRLATSSGRAIIDVSRFFEAIKNAAVQAANIRSGSITETDRKNAIKNLIKFRKLRRDAFPYVGFSDPSWDIILSLSYDAKLCRKTFIKSICIDSNLSNGTALRHLDILASNGVIRRSGDPEDGRLSIVRLTEGSINSIDALLNAWIREVRLIKLSELDFELIDSFRDL